MEPSKARFLSLEERKQIETLLKLGQTTYQISATLNRTQSTVSREIKRERERGNTPYNADLAQANFGTHFGMRKTDFLRDLSCTMTKKIEAIEQQIEIIFDILKENK